MEYDIFYSQISHSKYESAATFLYSDARIHSRKPELFSADQEREFAKWLRKVHKAGKIDQLVTFLKAKTNRSYYDRLFLLSKYFNSDDFRFLSNDGNWNE